MFDDPMRRPALSPQETEWLLFANEYRLSREPIQWNERTDFVMNCMAQIEQMGGLTEKQWTAAVNDYRLPVWRRYRSEMERKAQEAARKAAAEVQARYREHVRQSRRPSSTRDTYQGYGPCGPRDDEFDFPGAEYGGDGWGPGPG